MRIRDLLSGAVLGCLSLLSVQASPNGDFDTGYEVEQYDDFSQLTGYGDDLTDGMSGYKGDYCGTGSAIQMDGWLDVGGLYNNDQPTSGFNGPYNQTDRDEAALNQAYFVLEKPLGCGRMPGPGSASICSTVPTSSWRNPQASNSTTMAPGIGTATITVWRFPRRMDKLETTRCP